jgi:hypothetical protein
MAKPMMTAAASLAYSIQIDPPRSVNAIHSAASDAPIATAIDARNSPGSYAIDGCMRIAAMPV